MRATAGRPLACAAAFGAAFFISEAAAQAPLSCARRAEIVRHLAGEYHERPVAIGLSDNGALLEVLATVDGKTWTMLFSMPTGISCLMATGQDWQELPRLAPADKGRDG